jgi:glutamate dehydrogenase/leucine dehydrogenase
MILVNKASTEAQEKERLITKYTNALERLRCETERLSADDLKTQRNEIAIRCYEQNLESLRVS